MEEFDALMIRVNNIYYGRGKLVMSPEVQGEKRETPCDSSRATPGYVHDNPNKSNGACDDGHARTRPNGFGNSISVNNPSLGQVIVVDNVVDLSKNPECLGFEGSRKGHDSVGAVDLKMTEDCCDDHGKNQLRFISDSKATNPKPLVDSSKEGSGGLDVKKFDSPNKATIFDRRAGNRSVKSMFDSKVSRAADEHLVGSRHSGQVSENQQDSNLNSMESNNLEIKRQYFMPVKIDEKLLNNPWLSGEIVKQNKTQQKKDPGSFFTDASLVFRDKMKQWKSGHDIRRAWGELTRDILAADHIPQVVGSGVKGNDRDLNNNVVMEQSSIGNEEMTRPAPLQSNGKEAKISKWGYDDSKRGDGASTAEKFCLARSKEKNLSKSHGNLSSSLFESETELKRNEKDVSKDETNWRKISDTVLGHGAKLRPAKSLSSLIGHFESFIDDGKQRPFGQDKSECKKEESFLEGNGIGRREEEYNGDRYDVCGDRYDVCFGKQPAGTRRLIMRDINYTDGYLDNAIKDREEQSSKVVDSQMNGIDDSSCHGSLFSSTQPFTFDGKNVKKTNLKSLETVWSLSNGTRSVFNRTLGRLHPYDVVLGDRKQQREDGEEHGEVLVEKPKKAHESRFREVEKSKTSEGKLEFPSVIPSDDVNDFQMEKAHSMSMSDLAYNEELNAIKQSFYKERFERAASRPRIDEPSFEARIMKWRSLDELRMKFEANESESFEEGELEHFDGTLMEYDQ